MADLLFKEAESASEFQQIHSLNHRVFSEELGQHPRNSARLLVDALHTQNRYFIAVRNGVVVGMISVSSGPAFSIARRLPNPDAIHAFSRPLEVRLLAIDAPQRKRSVLAGLLWQVYNLAVSHRASHLMASAIIQRQSMYRKLGFAPLGPAVAEGSASFIPMAMQISEQCTTNRQRLLLHQGHWERTSKAQPISLLPGPVMTSPRVAAAFRSAPVSHRSAEFLRSFNRVRSLLAGLLPDSSVALFPGSGTLANDAVAANLRAIFGDAKGLVLSNGEFGDRLACQAARASLRFRHLSFAWGEPWCFAQIEEALDQRPSWIWAVQLETSTGVLNDTGRLLQLAIDVESAVALDCVSSVGATPIAADSDALYFASGVSGKSLGACAGLAFVHLNSKCIRRLAGKALCSSFDLLAMQGADGPQSTMSSSVMFALARSLEDDYGCGEAIAQRFLACSSLGQHTRAQIRSYGLCPISRDADAAPNITTFELPDPLFAMDCVAAGFQIAHESRYLKSRNWGQIATMGSVTTASIDRLFEGLRRR